MRGRVFAGMDNLGGSSANVITDSNADTLGGVMGEETHTLTVAEMPAHTHQQIGHNIGSLGPGWNAGVDSSSSQFNSGDYTNSTGGDGAHNNVQPTLFGNWIIKT